MGKNTDGENSSRENRRETMAEAPAPAPPMARGVIDSLVDKLTHVKETHPKVDCLLKDLVSLGEDLVNKFAGGRATHWQVKLWVKHSRQLFYDIEDMIDLKLGKTNEVDQSETDFEEQTKKFLDKIKEARGRSERYDLAPTSDRHDAAPSSKVPFDPQLILEKKGVLLGIDGPRKKLEEHLKDTQKKKKVVSVLGVGGIGKTTLATKVYEELKVQFDCYASVTVGGNSPIAALMDMFLQVNPEMVGHALNEQQVIRQLWEFLKNQRYFVVIDDIRNKHAWSIINCALPNNNLGSRILATTRVKDVAMSCSVRPADFIYEMKGLDEDDSRSLLHSAIPAQTEANFEEECPDMLKWCCGSPLAIIVTSGLLALKSADLGPLGKLEESSSLSIRDVLDICFADLSSPMKACFLYLSSFPENYTIKKYRLIWRWVAEGFIPKIGQASMWETGEGYFNELICRKLIWPVFDDYNDDQAVICTVHPVIHDFILSLSRQEEFHTTAAELISGPFPYGTIRRFSVDCTRQENNEADTLKSSVIHLSAVRSLTVFGVAGSLPDLGTFKHLRVLDLEDTKSLDDQQAERIELLFMLRYLGLGGTNITKLPQQIMALKHLTTLDLRRTKVRELPSFGNKKLLSLFAPFLTIPRGMGGMEELEELSEVLLGHDFLLNLDGSHADDVAGLVNKSSRLRVLGVKFGYLAETEAERMNHFLKEVGESKLVSLSLDGYPCDSLALLVKCWADKRPQELQKFELRMSDCLPLVPLEMASIEALTHLHIQVKVVEAQDVCTLGNLPNLILLKLYSEESTQERLSVSSKDGFPCLKVFWFRSSYFHGMGLQFEAGAMPRLQRLKMEFNARKTKFFYRNYDFGIQNLFCLQHVRAIILCKHAKDPEAKAAETSIRDQVSRIPYNALPIHGDDLPRKVETKEAERSPISSVDIRISILPESSWRLPLPGPISFVMEEDAMVSSSTGAMNSVLTKLATLMEVTGTDEQELVLRQELQLMNGLLKQLSDKLDLNLEMKECRNQMRELTYDIEDSIDDLMLHSVNEVGSVSTEKRVMPFDFIDRIQKLNAQVKKAHLPSMVRKTERSIFGPRRMPREHWLTNVYYYEHEKLVDRDQPSVESMKKIFADLSSYMKTCLLYLSRFPANQVLRKDQLIRMWTAEGFLPKRSVETWWETGESCFLELIIRKLVEPVYDDAEDVLLPTGCKVDDSVHGFITSLSSEENFVKSGQQGVFWRLSVSRPSYKEEDELIALFKEPKNSKVRSLTFAGVLGQRGLPNLSNFKHLRVLELKDIKALKYTDLYYIGRLSVLRYLGLAGSQLELLPLKILELEHLETLDLRCPKLKMLPAFKSMNLVSLLVDKIELTEGFGEMKGLQELSTVYVGMDCNMLAKMVSQSKQLKMLGVIIARVDQESNRMGLMDFLGTIANSNIQSLCLGKLPASVLDSLLVCWAKKRPHHLQKLQLRISVQQVPQNMSPSLIDLTHLDITMETLDTKGLCILGNLPNLIFLNLTTWEMTESSIRIDNGFPCLRVFWYNCKQNAGMGLQFEAGAMPQLRRLRLEFHIRKTESDFGIQFLCCLDQVHATIHCDGSTAAFVKALEATMRDQVSQNPNNPVLKITRTGVYSPDTVRGKGKRIEAQEDTLSLTTSITRHWGGMSLLVKRGPWGVGGSVYQFDIDVAPRHLESITVYHGDVVDAIAFSYMDWGMRRHTTEPWGGTSGGVTTIEFDESEFMTEIHGSYGMYYEHASIANLTFLTNHHIIHGPFGSFNTSDAAGAWENFSFAVRKNHSIVGFFGGAGSSYLSAIGIYIKPF